MILQDFSHGNGVQSKKIWNIWDETNQEIRQVFQDVVICDLDFSASQFAQELGLSIHKPVSRPRHQTSGWPQSLLGTFRNKGYLLVGSQRTCMVCQGVKGKVKLYSKLFKVNFFGTFGDPQFLVMFGTYQVKSQVKITGWLVTYASNISGTSFYAVHRKSSGLFVQSQTPSGAEQISSIAVKSRVWFPIKSNL